MLELQGVYAAALSAAALPRPVLFDIGLRLDAGEQVAIIGPSGAGKTSLLQLLACAQAPLRGHYRLAGKPVWELRRSALQSLRATLFLAPQLPPFPPRQRVVTAVLAGRLPAWSLGRSLRSLVYPSDLAAARAALAQFDLEQKLFERVDRLSGGERQRVGLARALLAPASLWLLDEPLSALDPQRAAQAAQAITHGARQRGITVLASLHHVDTALKFFPRILGLRQGRLLFDQPRHAVTPDLLQTLFAPQDPSLDAAYDAACGHPAMADAPLPALAAVMR